MNAANPGLPKLKVAAPSKDRHHQVAKPDDNELINTRCKHKGCCWRGRCPIHTARYHRGFAATDRLMRRVWS